MEVAGDAAEADGTAVLVDHRFLVGQAPSAAAAGVEMEFEVVAKTGFFANDLLILTGKGVAEGFGEEFVVARDCLQKTL